MLRTLARVGPNDARARKREAASASLSGLAARASTRYVAPSSPPGSHAVHAPSEAEQSKVSASGCAPSQP